MKQSGQDDSGVNRLFTNPRFYELSQRLIGGHKAKAWLAKTFWRPKSGEVIVDIGCGSGQIVEFLPPDVRYLGIDISADYIQSASQRYSAQGNFFHGTARDFLSQNDAYRGAADLVLCNGLLHHLSDREALEVLELARQIMKSNGRLVCLEATFLVRQTLLSRWILKRDRGKHIRSEQEWKSLFSQAFDSFSTHVLTGLLRIPYTHIVIECRNAKSL